MSIKEAFSRMNLTDKERMALEATLKGIDPETVFNAMENLAELLKPLYAKNLAAMGTAQPTATRALKGVGLTKKETAIDRCPQCGARLSPAEACLVDNLCHACWDDRHREEEKL